ncbi:MAG: LysM peptidoglycan-binding domain-containing protein [Chloroflexi bacterium]|nr:LysM peptidoglycan-binding domain-containing protein [Chloroflexota bacterium]
MTMEPSSYQKAREAMARRQRMSMLLTGGLAVLLVAVGLLLVYLWLQDAHFSLPFLSTDTPTPTSTGTATNTPEPTGSPTDTVEPSATVPVDTPTAAAPFIYIVEAGDTLYGITEKFAVQDVLIIMVLNNLNNDSVLFVGQQLIIPDPNTGLPSPTPIPANLPAGTVILYLVLPGDTVRSIAEKFLSTEDAIIRENDLDDPNAIFVGQQLRVPIRLVTPTPVPLQSATPSPVSGSTITPVPSGPSATPTP